MNNEPIAPEMTETIKTRCDGHSFPSLCWKAVIGGTVAAIGIHILLATLGVGAGLATFSPMTDTNPVAHFNVGAAIVWRVCGLVALWLGGLGPARFPLS